MKELKSRYKLGRVLGEGTFATVRLGEDLRSHEQGISFFFFQLVHNAFPTVAIKEIRKSLSEERALHNEVEVMRATGKHENIISLRDVFDSNATLYLVMDVAIGGELFDRIIERGELSERNASEMIKEAVLATKHLHDRQICHLDIKPENLLLTTKVSHR